MSSSNDDNIDEYNETTDDVGADRTEFSCASHQVYVDSGNQKKPKTEMRPVNVDFAKEDVRRSRILRIHPTPRPLNWPKSQKIEWLEANPVQDSVDILFLRGEVIRIKEILESSIGRRAAAAGVRYDIKFAFLRRADAQSRQELDARNLENRQLAVYELIATLWNSELFNPMAPPSHCHSDFAAASDCSYEQVAGLQPATPKKVADCLASIWNDLLKIIPKWEQSGQGEGGRDNKQEEQNNNDDEQQQEDDSLTNASAAPSTVSSTGSRTPRGRRHVDMQNDEQEQARKMAPLVASIDKLAAIHEGMAHKHAQDREQQKELEDKRASLEVRQMERKRKFERMCELRDLARQYRRERAQLDSKGENFAVLKDFYT